MLPPSFENLYEYNTLEFYMVSHTLTLAFAVMLAALFYFVLTIRTVSPRYRISSVLSVVVMVSAFLILFFQQQSWERAFVWNAETEMFVRDDSALPFSNGYRYLNWLIDVPMLLFQILFVVELAKEKRASIRNWFWFSGALMIVTGYIGQFYETAEDQTAFFFWGAVSTAFFFHVLFLMYRVIQEGRKGMAPGASRI
ncbi:MAG: bacteriorhodopsin, partial [Phototrophicaceae bacterium]